MLKLLFKTIFPEVQIQIHNRWDNLHHIAEYRKQTAWTVFKIWGFHYKIYSAIIPNSHQGYNNANGPFTLMANGYY